MSDKLIAIVEEQFIDCTTVEEVCKFYVEYRLLLDEQMKIRLQELTESEVD